MKKPILMIWLPVVAVLASWTLSATAASVGALGIGEPIEPLDKGGVEWGSETNAVGIKSAFQVAPVDLGDIAGARL